MSTFAENSSGRDSLNVSKTVKKLQLVAICTTGQHPVAVGNGCFGMLRVREIEFHMGRHS